NHYDSIPNSWVKHDSSDDTTGVAPWDNSSMPALILLKKPLSLRAAFFVFNSLSEIYIQLLEL
ncbi:MAG: hypothetical protein ACXITR_12580, partial [Cyanobacterium sp.]